MLSAPEAALRRKGHTVETASNGLEGVAKLDTPFQAVITDLRMPGMDGIELLDHIRRTLPDMPVVMLSAFGTISTAVEAIKAGANDFLVKPFSQDALDEVLSRLSDCRPRFGPESTDLITENPGMRTLFRQASQAARTQATVLVQA